MYDMYVVEVLIELTVTQVGPIIVSFWRRTARLTATCCCQIAMAVPLSRRDRNDRAVWLATKRATNLRSFALACTMSIR